MPLRLGEALEVRVEKAVYRGVGLARHEGQVLFVPRGLPGERLRVRIVGLEKGYLRAALEERLETAPGTRNSPCRAFPACGGCSYQALEYASQVELKRNMLVETLRRAGVSWPGEVSTQDSPEEGWRTRASLHVSLGEEGARVGFYEEGSRRIVSLRDGCPQLSAGMNFVLGRLPEILSEWPGPARKIRHVHVAEGGLGRERVVFFEGDLGPDEAARLGNAAKMPQLTGIGASLTRGRGESHVLLHGSPFVHSTVGERVLRSHARAFFQGNRFLLSPLADHVAALGDGEGPLLDLYGGAGLFALSARSQREALILESSELSVEDARHNVDTAGAQGIRVLAGDVEEVLPRVPSEEDERIILDPPRVGLSKGVVAELGARKGRLVVYVSCDPTTLARDVGRLSAFGYRIEAMRAFDLFPDTFHLETVVKLTRG